LPYFEVRVAVHCPLATAFAFYTHTENWKRFPFIRNAEWVLGRPWEEGSRMRLTLDATVADTVDQVLTHFEPERAIAYLSHFSGFTMETRLSFRSVSEQVTDIHGRMEFLGVLSRVVGFAVEPVIERSTRQFFEDVKRECELAWLAREPVADGVAPAVSKPEAGS
jgi:hypothetical protein